tara:strand:- start:56 stop:229 length:174 start_codon:yes stop_codon:yes gene_type:complete
MNPVSRKLDDESQQLINEYLKKGGEVTIGEPFRYSENIEFTGGFYARRKKKNEESKG